MTGANDNDRCIMLMRFIIVWWQQMSPLLVIVIVKLQSHQQIQTLTLLSTEQVQDIVGGMVYVIRIMMMVTHVETLNQKMLLLL